MVYWKPLQPEWIYGQIVGLDGIGARTISRGFKRVLLDWVGNWIEGEMGLKGVSGVFKIWRIFLIRREDFWLVSLFSFLLHSVTMAPH